MKAEKSISCKTRSNSGSCDLIRLVALSESVPGQSGTIIDQVIEGLDRVSDKASEVDERSGDLRGS